MFAHELLAHRPLKTHAARAQAALWRQVELLETLAETGLQLAQAPAAQAVEAPAERPEATAMAFSRVARAVRMTALLQSRLIKDLDEARSRHDYTRRDDAFRAEQAGAAKARLDPANDHKSRVETIIARVARTQGEAEDRIERIISEAAERLDDDDIYGDVLTRPVGELVALICRDLGLDPDWGRLAQEAWAQAEMACGAQASPFARPPPFTGSDRSYTIDPDGDHEAVERAFHLDTAGRHPGSPLNASRRSPPSPPSAFQPMVPLSRSLPLTGEVAS